MPSACETFEIAIQDAQNLLDHFDKLNPHPPTPELEVLKRAGLIMAMTAWETYVEDRLTEACNEILGEQDRGLAATFMRKRLSMELKQLHNPESSRTTALFTDYAGTDLSDAWAFDGRTAAANRRKLNDLMRLRGDVVHRSRVAAGKTDPHPVTRSDLDKAISFLCRLVDATEKAVAKAVSPALESV